jgi:D-aminopeptidase
MPRIRELDIFTGGMPAGALNGITDVAGVRVGHSTLVRGEGALTPGSGPVRTGVTVILPHGGNLYQEKVRAAVHTINGFGKVAGFEQVRELGLIEAPIALTNTLNVGLVLDALVQHAIRQNPQIGISPESGSVNIVVGETNDSILNDIQGRHVRLEHVWQAIEGASPGPVVEGAVGAGTGTICFGWKGGMGSASRTLPGALGGFTLGALVQSNFGSPGDLIIAGYPVGRHLSPPNKAAPEPAQAPGSIMMVLATDAPLASRQLERLCVRAAAGLARVGGVLGHGSGDFVIAFSTAYRLPHRAPAPTVMQPALANEAGVMSALFRAVIESVEEAVLNSLAAAQTMTGRDGHIAYALPLDRVGEFLRAHSE